MCVCVCVPKATKKNTINYLASALHQVHHPVIFVRRAQPSRRAIEAERPPRVTPLMLAAQSHHLNHDGRGVLAAEGGTVSLVAKAWYIGTSLLSASQTLEHVYGVRCIGLASPRVIHLPRLLTCPGRGGEACCSPSLPRAVSGLSLCPPPFTRLRRSPPPPSAAKLASRGVPKKHLAGTVRGNAPKKSA